MTHRARALLLALAILPVVAPRAEHTMRAGLVSGTGVQIRSVAVPTPDRGQVRIRVRAASVNPVDWKVAERGGADGHIAGRDFAGVIEALGSDTGTWRIGQAVIGVAASGSGSYAEFALASVHAIATKPERMSFEEAAGLPVVAETAWRALVTVANVQRGQQVLIHGGAGGVGSMAVQIAHARGAHVVATASAQHLDFVRSLGADEVIDYRTTRFEDRVKNLDMVLDTVDLDTGLRSLGVLRPNGILVSIVGALPEERCSAARVRCAVTGTATGAMLPQVAQLADSGRLRVSIEEVLPLAEAAAAWGRNRAGHTRGKIILRISQ